MTLLTAIACAEEQRRLPGESAPHGEASLVPSSVTGVLVDLQSKGLADVRSFTLKSGTNVYEIRIAEDVDYGFALGHLNEHLTSSDPVRVELEERDGRLYALSIEDI